MWGDVELEGFRSTTMYFENLDNRNRVKSVIGLKGRDIWTPIALTYHH